MKDFSDIKNVYLLGIGGIGMSAIARYFKNSGKNVIGYDRNNTTLTKNLINEGIDIHYNDDISFIPDYLKIPDTIIVYTPAIPDNHKEFTWFNNKGFQIYKRAFVLGKICEKNKYISVAGTHGKTTISTMLAVILKESGIGCGAFLGGISKNYKTNYLPFRESNSWLVTEADEYDRSFLNLNPDMVLISSIDADHLDVYGSYKDIKQAFNDFVKKIRKQGKLVVKKGLAFEESDDFETFTYSLNEVADFFVTEINVVNGFYEFNLKTPTGSINNIHLKYPGLINVENALGAASLAYLAGVTGEEIKKGLEQYEGVERRFDIRFKNNEIVYIDDYAHHPEEIKAVVNSVKHLYTDKKITGIFQPHLYSRTRDFAKEFAESLDLFDEVILLPVYPARELPIEGVSSKLIYSFMKNKNCQLLEKNNVPEWINNNRIEILMTLGAGDIDNMVDEMVKILSRKQNVK